MVHLWVSTSYMEKIWSLGSIYGSLCVKITSHKMYLQRNEMQWSQVGYGVMKYI